MIDVRLRTRIPDEELEQKLGKILTDDDYNLLLTRDCIVRKPNGKPLIVYRRGALDREVMDPAYPVLHELRSMRTNNRGMASGSKRVKRYAGNRTDALDVSSGIIGAFDPQGPKQYCRLTAWTGQETEKFETLFPLFRQVGSLMADAVPDRFAAQQAVVDRTDPAWVIPGTPFTTITINNTYPTGVHTDKGDLDEGFSNITAFRMGSYTGGVLVLPRYRVGVDLQDGDVIHFDAHEWHGNTAIVCSCGDTLNGLCEKCGAERISLVCYYRTKMQECGTPEDEADRQRQYAEQRNAALLEPETTVDA